MESKDLPPSIEDQSTSQNTVRPTAGYSSSLEYTTVQHKKNLSYLLLLDKTQKQLDKLSDKIVDFTSELQDINQDIDYNQNQYDVLTKEHNENYVLYIKSSAYFHRQLSLHNLLLEDFILSSPMQQEFAEMNSLYADTLAYTNVLSYIDYVREMHQEKINTLTENKSILEDQIFLYTQKYEKLSIQGILNSHLYMGQPVWLNDLVADKHIVDDIQKIITMYKNPQPFVSAGLSLPKSILLYGQKDTGKTFAAKVVASELSRKMYHIKTYDLFSENNIDPNAMVYDLFSLIINEVQITKKPCIIFLDELETIINSMWEYSSANQMIIANTLIKNIVNIQKSDLDIMILATVSKTKNIEDTLLKYDVFPKQIHFSSLDNNNQQSLFSKLFVDSAGVVFSKSLDFAKLTHASSGFSPDYIKKIATLAKEHAVYQNIMTPSTTPFEITQELLMSIVERIKIEDKLKTKRSWFF